MKFDVKSREDAVRMSYEALQENIVIISITDMFSEIPDFATNERIKGVLKLQFNDVEGWEDGHISSNDSNKIIDFVEKFVGAIEKIVVHCEYGISRSAGICAAIMLILNENDDYVLENPYFCPNIYCYRSVLQAYFNCNSKENRFSNITDYRLSHTV